ncbi:MAG TPA: response regulator [Steroidobacteraceae bacterium]|jgi:DNA-binding NarL/FixJ family response regulator|nr:response regulator [Steroidobacteraceae bacterium]
MAATVLIVEDQILIAWHLSDLIEGAGHRVLAIARDPAEAMEAAAKQRPDFALMDIRLHGGTSGLEAARMLYECWGVRSIYLSANLDPATRAQTDALQPLGFIGKPFLPAEAIEAVERAVKMVEPVR